MCTLRVHFKENLSRQNAYFIDKKDNIMEAVQNYINQNKQRFLDELLEFLRIPSVSADTKYKEDVLKAATWLSNELKKIGMEKVEIIPTPGHPVVYGEKL